MRRCGTLRLICAALILSLAGFSPASAEPKQVVLLYDERTDLPGLSLNDVRLMFLELTENKGLGFTFEQDPRLPRALAGDAVKVRQVLINLLSNAVKFTERGRVTVRVSSRAGATRDRHLVAIAVEDTGPGIEPRNLTRIFDAFDQADSKVRIGGSGLGLAISRNSLWRRKSSRRSESGTGGRRAARGDRRQRLRVRSQLVSPRSGRAPRSPGQVGSALLTAARSLDARSSARRCRPIKSTGAVVLGGHALHRSGRSC
jgi:anti-sigma regulatory factor (Ser/Thr protein kinase)